MRLRAVIFSTRRFFRLRFDGCLVAVSLSTANEARIEVLGPHWIHTGYSGDLGLVL